MVGQAVEQGRRELLVSAEDFHPLLDGISAEQGIVDGVSVRLDVAGEAAEHVADRGARVLGLVLEEDVLLVGQDDEEVALLARLPPPVREWLWADRDSGGISGQTECVLASVLRAREHDRAETGANLFDRARHRGAIELHAVRGERACSGRAVLAARAAAEPVP